jgi:hypothetical protein
LYSISQKAFPVSIITSMLSGVFCCCFACKNIYSEIKMVIKRLFADLEALTYSKLSALHSELESLIQVYNEALVQELALKDELEYEKELKNTFISLLLAVQNKRRAFIAEKKRKQTSPKSRETEREPQVINDTNTLTLRCSM